MDQVCDCFERSELRFEQHVGAKPNRFHDFYRICRGREDAMGGVVRQLVRISVFIYVDRTEAIAGANDQHATIRDTERHGPTAGCWDQKGHKQQKGNQGL